MKFDIENMSTRRVRMLALGAAIAFLGLLSILPEAKADVGIATGSTSGTYYRFGQDIKAACSKTVNISVYESAGGLSNIDKVLEDKRTQYAFMPQDALAYKSKILEDARVAKSIRMIMPMYNEEIHLVAGNNSIKGLADLAGKRVVVGSEGSGNYATAEIIKAKTDLNWTDVAVSPDQGVTQLLLGQADAMIMVAGKPVKLLSGLGAAAKGKLRLIPMSHPELDSFYIRANIPDGTYDWAPLRTPTYAVKTILVTYDFKSQYQDEIAKLVNCIASNLDAFQQGKEFHDKWREVDLSSYKQVKWPVHPVAERILKGK